MSILDAFRRPRSFYPKEDARLVTICYQNEHVAHGRTSFPCKSHTVKNGMMIFYDIYGRECYRIPECQVIYPLRWD